MSDTLAIVLFLALPILIPALGIQLLNWWARRRPTSSVRFYSVSVGGSKVVVSSHALAKILLIFIPVYFLSSIIIGLSLVFLVLFLVWLVVFGAKRQAKSATSEATHTVLESLKRTAQQVESARVHLESLAADVQARQAEVEEVERLDQSLRTEVERKLKEVEAWRVLTDEQKSAFIEATREALQKTSTIRLATVALWSVALNIIASAAWSLMGAPGQAELQQVFQRFQALLGV